ncbi:vomeronasal type-1 receptor 3-like [Grammomys surdaster]|uniref:vomeronasal type-1 receptor 3-like n=1 Tax=Grammomys surdaster TaxID=491861 RepID=UPI00109FA243|nr:vomeronasal type-1 receptor 3-like [Grammomys surdaster]
MQDIVTLNETVSYSRDLALGMIFLHQTIVGFLGNLLLCYYNFHCFMKGEARPTDLIVHHLTVANFLVILTKGVPQTMAALGMKHFFNNAGCKLVFYVHRVARGMCIGSTCFLSVFQAITISPMTSRWKEVKWQVSEHLGTSNILILCWVVNIVQYVSVPMHVTSKQNHMEKMDFEYCEVVGNRVTYPLHLILWSSYDVLCLGLMLWSSGSMIFILYRHKHRVQHIHRNNYSSRFSPESRATQGILALVSTFVPSYILSSVFSLILALFNGSSLWLVKISVLMAAFFPTASPFILMSGNRRFCMFISACFGKNVCFFRLVR